MESIFKQEAESLQLKGQQQLDRLNDLEVDRPELRELLEKVLDAAREGNLRIRSVLYPNCQFEPQGEVSGEVQAPTSATRNLMWNVLVESCIAALGELVHSITQIDRGKADRAWMEGGGAVRKLRDFVPALVGSISSDLVLIENMIQK